MSKPPRDGLVVAFYCTSSKTIVDMVAINEPQQLLLRLAFPESINPDRPLQETILRLKYNLTRSLASAAALTEAELFQSIKHVIIVHPGQPWSLDQHTQQLFYELGWRKETIQFLTECEAAASYSPARPIVVVSAGTGCTVAGSLDCGPFVYRGGQLFPLDAEGGGYSVGTGLLKLFLQHRLPQPDASSDLVREVLRRYAAKNVGELFNSMLFGDPFRNRVIVSDLAITVTELSRQGNAAAHAILAQTAEAVTQNIYSMLQELGATSTVQIVLVGGLARLSEPYQQLLRQGIYKLSVPCTVTLGDGFVETGGLVAALTRSGVACKSWSNLYASIRSQTS